MTAALGELALQEPELADLGAALGQAGMVGGGDLAARDLDALAIELLEALDQLLLLGAGKDRERRLGLDHLPEQGLVVGLVEGIQGAIRSEAAMVQLVGEAGQAERRRLSLLGPVADPELERARLRAPGVEALEHALERQGLEPGLAERLRQVELQSCRQIGPTGGHRLQQLPRGCGQQDRGLAVADLDHEPQEIGQERRIGEIVPPGQHRAELAPVGALALPEAAERRPAERVVTLDPTARGLGHDHAIEQAQLLGRIGRRLGLGDGAQRRPRPPVVAIEPAPPPATVGGEVLAGCGEIDRPGRTRSRPGAARCGPRRSARPPRPGPRAPRPGAPRPPSAGPCRRPRRGSSARLQQASTRSPSWASVGGAARRPSHSLSLPAALSSSASCSRSAATAVPIAW